MRITSINTSYNYNKPMSFLGKNPESIKVAENEIKKIWKPNRKHINNTFAVDLKVEAQNQIAKIKENLDFIKTLTSTSICTANPAGFAKYRDSFKSIIPVRNPYGFSFNLGKESLTITKGKDKSLLRLAICRDDYEFHYLISNHKVVSNLSPNSPHLVPHKLRFMTAEELEKSDVYKYIEIADKKIAGFREHMENYEPIVRRKIKKTAKAEVPEISTPEKKEIKEAVTTPIKKETQNVKPEKAEFTNLVNKLINIFENGAENLSSKVEAKISPRTNKVLSMKIKTENGDEITIAKRIGTGYGDSLRYINLEKVSEFGKKEYINIDLITNSFLKTNKITGKPVVWRNAVHEIPQAEITKTSLKTKLAEWTKDFWKNGNEKGAAKITVMSAPDTSKKAILEIENDLLSMGTKEIQHIENTVLKNSAAKQLAETSPKIKPTEQKTSNLTETKTPTIEEIIEKATKDADEFAEIYFKAFTKEFVNKLEQKLAEFKAKLDQLLKQ